jgi:membrane-associated phospholipid phosphatase
MPRIAAYLEATSFAGLAGLLTVCANLVGASLSGLFVDEHLIAVDRALGYDWLAVYRLSHAHPWITHVLDFAYASMGLQLLAVPLLLTFSGQAVRKWGFLTAWMFASVITIIIFPFAPAEGAPVHFGVHPDALSKPWFWWFGPQIDHLRAGAVRDISSGAMGLVSVPSFHAATGVMFMWASWRLNWFRIPVTILNIVMIASTPISGAHYMVDVLAGVAVGCTSVLIARWLVIAASVEERWFAVGSERGTSSETIPDPVPG